MAIQTSGPITHTDIATEFGYSTTDFSLNADGVPILNSLGDSRVVGSSQVKESDFYGLSSSVTIAGQYWRLWRSTHGLSTLSTLPSEFNLENYVNNASTARPPAQWHDQGPDPYYPYHSPNDFGGQHLISGNSYPDPGTSADITHYKANASAKLNNIMGPSPFPLVDNDILGRCTITRNLADTPEFRVNYGSGQMPDAADNYNQHYGTSFTNDPGLCMYMISWERLFAVSSAPGAVGTFRAMMPVQKLEIRPYNVKFRIISATVRSDEPTTWNRTQVNLVTYNTWTGALASSTSSNVTGETVTQLADTGQKKLYSETQIDTTWTPTGEFCFVEVIFTTTQRRKLGGADERGMRDLNIFPL